MRSKILGIVIAVSTAIGCGSDELFDVQLKDNQIALDQAAVVSLASHTVTFDEIVVVGDLDGDGIDDALVRPMFALDDNVPEMVYVLYGASGLTGEITLEDLPSLVGVGGTTSGVSIVAVGDVDGDGLADVLVTKLGDLTVAEPDSVFLVYGSTTRFEGATPALDAGVNLVGGNGCWAGPWLGDLDGDGMNELAVVTYDAGGDHSRLIYGRHSRLSGTLDVTVMADADVRMTPITMEAPVFLYGVGDVDGDGRGEFFARDSFIASGNEVADLRLVLGSATRLTGEVAVDDLPQTRFTADTLTDPGVGMTPVTPLGDLDGDGLADFALIGASPFGQRIFYGRSGGFGAQVDGAAPDALLVATANVLNPLSKIASSDLNGDGVRDLVMSDAGFNNNDGAIYVLPGGSARLAGTIDPSIMPNVYVGGRQRQIGCVVAQDNDCIGHERIGTRIGLGDLRGEGHPSVFTSAPWYNFIDRASEGDYGAISRGYIVSPNP